MKRPSSGRILEQPPVVGTVATALPRVLAERLQKPLPVLRIDVVFDRHQDRSAVLLDARVVTGAAQCIDGEKSTFAPVCNFHRQVSRIATIAPAAATNRAAGSPATAATSPQIALRGSAHRI